MLVTRDFVMINFPKTGSSFVRHVTKRVYEAKETRLQRWWRKTTGAPDPLQELILPKIDLDAHAEIEDQHGTWRQIPESYRNRSVITVTRNPLARYVSNYLFRWWRQFPPTGDEEISAEFPDWPELTFEDYFRFAHRFPMRNQLRGVEPKIPLGMQTVQFLRFYFPDPYDLLARIDDEWIDGDRWRDEMPEITFLHQEQLATELKAFLARIGIAERWLSVIDEAEPVNVTKRQDDQKDFRTFYSDEFLREVIERDRLLFRIFPEYLPEGVTL